MMDVVSVMHVMGIMSVMDGWLGVGERHRKNREADGKSSGNEHAHENLREVLCFQHNPSYSQRAEGIH